MDTLEQRRRVDEVTRKIIGSAQDVINALGAGFLEKVYENALALELRNDGLRIEQQRTLQVYYKGTTVGDYAADLFVESCVIVELKTVRALDEVHAAQCMNYLKATGVPVCLLINFGKPRLEVRRLVHAF